MKTKTCGECRHFDGRYNLCAVTSDFCTVEPDYSACDDFEQKPKPTNGDRIRQGGDYALAHFKSEHRCDVCAYHAQIDTAPACRRPEGKICFDGMLAWLNAPADAPDTNVGTKESEEKDDTARD